MLTSVPATDRTAKRTWRFVYGVWAVMVVQALIYIVACARPGPIIDELGFTGAVAGDEPFWSWLWKLHNEHRFVLPRLIWLPLTQLAGDYRAGCYVSLVGVSLFALFMIQLARRLRGRLHFADAFFPISLLHAGHWENLRMGYQLAFMMSLVLAGVLLRLILTTQRDNLLRRGLQAGGVTLLLLGCGASGLAFGPFMAVWLLMLTGWLLFGTPSETAEKHCHQIEPCSRDAEALRSGARRLANLAQADTRSTRSAAQSLRVAATRVLARVFQQSSRYRALILLLPAALVPVYIWLYLQGFARPDHHADPVVVWGGHAEAAWQALRSGLQAISMAFGPAVIGLWPASAIIIGLALFESALKLLRVALTRPAERARAWGLLLFIAAVLFMTYGIGWGRCVFLTRDVQPGDMGLSSRYGWIVWPALGGLYFQWLLFGNEQWSRRIPIALFAISVFMLPFNVVTGFWVGAAEDADGERPMNLISWLWLIPVAGLLLLVLCWRFYHLSHVVLAERARESFRLQRERLEMLFLQQASKSGSPRGLRWLSCRFSPDAEFARERHTKQIVALVPVTIEFEAIPGGDMEGLPAVSMPRQGTAVLHFVNGEWLAKGRVVFNLVPRQTLDQFAADYAPLTAPQLRTNSDKA